MVAVQYQYQYLSMYEINVCFFMYVSHKEFEMIDRYNIIYSCFSYVKTVQFSTVQQKQIKYIYIILKLL